MVAYFSLAEFLEGLARGGDGPVPQQRSVVGGRLAATATTIRMGHIFIMGHLGQNELMASLPARVMSLSLLSLPLAACAPVPGAEPADVERLEAEILAVHPFDESSFTQGLEVDEAGGLLVGTGTYGDSRIYRRTGVENPSQVQELPAEFFGEGLTRHEDTVWQLTWREGVALKRDAETLLEVGRAEYEGEGWGLCARPEELIMSDGSTQLRRMDPGTMAERERFPVTLAGEPVNGLNELECVGGDVYANVFLSTDLLRIDADTGEVTAVIDASGLPNNAEPDPDHVLNGIAHLPGSDRFYLSGKRWPDLYEVRFVAAQ